MPGRDQQLAEPLTPRERDVLAQLAQGYTAPEIAQRLTLAPSSVKTHIQHLYGKLGVHGKREAITCARTLGLLASDPEHSAVPAGPRHNLPAQVTRFFGREAEMAELAGRLGEARLVTLTGAGGVGKTRLSLRVAETVLDNYTHGVWLVELAPLNDPALVPQQVVTALGMRDDPNRTVLEALTTHLRNRHLLLVLDNCEHLLEASARLAEDLLRACPRLTILATSREALGAAGEAVYVVPSLPFPKIGQALTQERLNAFAAVSLFADRARLAVPDYQVAAHNVAAIGRIVRRLDGIPLAIEMAAARVKLLTAEQVADRLEAAFDVLANRSRTALPRHQTLRATLDWSYGLLNDEEQKLPLRLSVFAGGCTLEAAKAVCTGEGLEPGRVFDVLSSLVDKSMVVAERRPGAETRYRLLEMVRQYGAEHLSTDQVAGLRQRQFDYYMTLAIPPRELASHAEVLEFNKRRATERANLRLALEWAFGEGADLEAGPKLLLKVSWVFPIAEATDWFQRALAWCDSHPGVPTPLHVEVMTNSATLLWQKDLPAAIAMAERGVTLARTAGPQGARILLFALR